MSTLRLPPTFSKTISFVWTIENTDRWFERGHIYSPGFRILPHSTDRWYLALRNENSRGFTEILLKQLGNQSTNENKIFECEVSLLRRDGSKYLTVKGQKRIFLERGFSFELLEKDNLCELEKELYPNGKLALYCRLLCFGLTLPESNICRGLTTLTREACMFIWPINDLSSLKLGQILSRREKLRFESHPSITFNLSLMEEGDEIQIKLMKGHSKIEFITSWRISIVHMSGFMLHRRYFLWDMTKNEDSVNLTHFMKKSELVAKKETHLPNDTLILGFYCVLIQKSSVVFDFQGTKSSNNELNLKSNSNPSESLDWSLDLINFYKDSISTDIALLVGREVFYAHKAILRGRSDFLKTMLTANKETKKDTCIRLKNIEPKTFYRLFEYMYTYDTKDLLYEEAASVCSAAHKYGLVGLKKKCLDVLKTGISASNACEMLLLADKYNDNDLKNFVQNFFLDQKFKMFRSAEWRSFLKNNLKLASEIMQNVILQITE